MVDRAASKGLKQRRRKIGRPRDPLLPETSNGLDLHAVQIRPARRPSESLTMLCSMRGEEVLEIDLRLASSNGGFKFEPNLGDYRHAYAIIVRRSQGEEFVTLTDASSLKSFEMSMKSFTDVMHKRFQQFKATPSVGR